MKKPDRLKLGAVMGIAAALIFYAGTGAWAQLDTDVPAGHIKIQTAFETDWGVSTAGKSNRNNNNNNIPGSGQGFSTNGSELQAAVGRIDPTITFRTRDDIAEAMGLDNADVYLHFRYWADAEQFINGPSIYEVGQGAYLTPGSARYPGDAWSARVSEHEYEAEANEAYIDLRKGPFALRLGKQQVVYGEELGVQTLDQVDSLDFTKFQTFEIGALEYSDVRIGEWTAKGSYQLPDFSDVGINNSLITGFVSPDFQPDYFAAIGSQLNDEPAAEPIGDYGNLRKARNKIVYGGVASTTVYGVDLTANFYATPDHIGWFALAPSKFDGLPAGFKPDPFAGQDFLGPAVGPVDLLLQRRFSRDFIYGGSASYTIPSLDFPGAFLLNGDIFHFSAAYTPHKTFWTAASIASPQRGQADANRRDQHDAGRRKIYPLEPEVPLDVLAGRVELQEPQHGHQRHLRAGARSHGHPDGRNIAHPVFPQQHLGHEHRGRVRHQRGRQLVHAAVGHLQADLEPGVRRVLELL